MNKFSAMIFASAISLFASQTQASPGGDKFVANCSGCHGEDAAGIPGMAPPLKDAPLWQGLGDKRSEYIAGVVTGGMGGTLHTPAGDTEGMVMPPQDFIDTADLVDITAYVLQEVNHVPGGPDAAMIDKYKKSPLSHEELLKIRNGGK